MDSRDRRRGFTLIELMIVVAIVGILAMLAIPRYQRYVIKSRRSAAQTALADLATQEEQYYLDHTSYTSSISALGRSASAADLYTLSIPTATSDSYVIQATARAGTVQVQDRENGVSCATLTVDSTGNHTPSGCW